MAGILAPVWSFRCGTVKGKDLLRHWLRHLVLQLVPGAGLPRRSVLAGSDKVYELPPLAREESAAMLERLLLLYWQGLCAPLPFYPAASLAFARAMGSGKAEAAALEAARREWQGNEFSTVPGEGEDRHYQLCFRDRPPFDERFARLALEIYAPLLMRLEEVR